MEKRCLKRPWSGNNRTFFSQAKGKSRGVVPQMLSMVKDEREKFAELVHVKLCNTKCRRRPVIWAEKRNSVVYSFRSIYMQSYNLLLYLVQKQKKLFFKAILCGLRFKVSKMCKYVYITICKLHFSPPKIYQHKGLFYFSTLSLYIKVFGL